MTTEHLEQGSLELNMSTIPSDQLDTPTQLKALYADKRASFLPASHLEKGTAMRLLSYVRPLDQAAEMHSAAQGHPAQTAGQLQEIFLHQLKPMLPDRKAGEAAGKEALHSVVLEYGDFLTNALTHKEHLRLLDKAVAACPNPSVTLAEELGLDHPGLPGFARYYDLSEYRAKGRSPIPGYDPLHVIERRQGLTDEDRQAGRNKYIEDEYTTGEKSTVISDRITELAQILHLGPLHLRRGRAQFTLTEEAVRDQQFRINFWTARLREAQKHGAARPAAKMVLEQLGISPR